MTGKRRKEGRRDSQTNADTACYTVRLSHHKAVEGTPLGLVDAFARVGQITYRS